VHFHRKQDEFLCPDPGCLLDSPALDGEGSVQGAVDAQPALPHCRQVRAAGHKGDIMPGPRQQRPEIAAHSSSPHDCNTHCFPCLRTVDDLTL
jgi:hypothetical protein